ncbi:MAG: 50S ribosomal protein L15 [Gammaproteobacteria bacterium]|jgi:large subunit ribosomal protein L15|nr:50S ribosomal protein L15 [Gammaproteobacteria bacterium]
MRLNDLAPAPGARPRATRVGRGPGSGLGKTCGRGHKGQHARAGGLRKVGFEGGQMPLQRRLPKTGFRSPHAGRVRTLRLDRLSHVAAEVVDLDALKKAGLVPQHTEAVKIVVRGSLTRPVRVRGLALSRGAQAALEAAGGRVED